MVLKMSKMGHFSSLNQKDPCTFRKLCVLKKSETGMVSDN